MSESNLGADDQRATVVGGSLPTLDGDGAVRELTPQHKSEKSLGGAARQNAGLGSAEGGANLNRSTDDSQAGALRDERSVWLAKKAHSETEKNIELLANRIELLRTEEERTLKKIHDTRSKTKNILETKKRNEDVQQKKQFSRKNDDEFLRLMQKKSMELRRQQEEERQAIRQALLELKREETNEIKRQSLENARLIEQAKRKQYEQKRRKHDRVVHIVDNSRKVIETYWTERLRFFEDQQDLRRHEHLNAKSQKELVLDRLEKEELELIKRLQFSQQIHEQACRELDAVIALPASDYLKGAQQINNNTQSQNSTLGLENSSLSQVTHGENKNKSQQSLAHSRTASHALDQQ